ncbi:MAG: MarR family transcriptional regulator [Planctomycetes bacterium]|nr:MarR family transcriptional regulator [Planctomycetota bacterium]
MPRKSEQPETVQQAIRQTQPFRSPRHEAMIGLLLTAQELTRPVQELLAERAELTHQQYNVLRILRGSKDIGLPTLDVAERMIERTPGVTRLIDRLEKKGLVRRERSSKDRRQVFCFLTETGERLLAELDEPIDQLDERLMRGLDDQELRDLTRMLDRLRHHARQGGAARSE